MTEEKSREQHYKELLKETRESIEVVKKLMKSSNEGVRLEAVRSFSSLVEQTASILEVIYEMTGVEPERRDKNPLARRSRIER